MPSPRIEIPRERLAEFCQRWKITELSLFGSVLRDDFRADSDVDVLVSFAQGAQWGLSEILAMERELEQILGRKADLVDRKAVEKSENYIRRGHILQSLEPVYVAR